MESSAKQEKQPKSRLIVRLGLFLASHHIFFRFTSLFSLLSHSFYPTILAPPTHSSHLGSVLFPVVQALSHSFYFLHLPKTRTSQKMLLYLVSNSSVQGCVCLVTLGSNSLLHSYFLYSSFLEHCASMIVTKSKSF
jgi:hypothetical protein